MLLPILRSAALAAAISLVSLGASAQTFGEFLSKPDLPLTFMGVDFSAAQYYGPPMTVDQNEMKEQFTRINELLVREADKYNLTTALHRNNKVEYAIHLAESANQKIDPGTVIVASGVAPQAPFTSQTVEDRISHYNYSTSSADNSGMGLVFVVETLDKTREQETFWVAFVNLSTRKMLYTEKMAGTGAGFGFRNHWASPLNAGIKLMKSRYNGWKKKFAKS